jgi:uncharacterized sodium:solute symporter family permease YidK
VQAGPPMKGLRAMGIGGGIFLIVVGAILAFAVSDSVDAINLAMIGYICMAAGVLALIISLVLNAQRTNTTHREVIERHDDRRPPAPPAY